MNLFQTLMFALAVALPAQAAEPDNCIDGITRSTQAGHFRVGIIDAPSPVPVSAMHAWTVTLAGTDGKPLSGARLSVGAAMPQHNHGLLSEPRVRALKSPGQYRVEGIKFHMPGYWEVTFRVEAGGKADRLMLPLDL
jgi:hypothetical protein